MTLWRNAVGREDKDGVYRVKPGLGTGSSDLIGILAPSGRLVAIELKTQTGRCTPEQELFLQLVRNSGGIAFVARSVEEFLLAMKAYT